MSTHLPVSLLARPVALAGIALSTFAHASAPLAEQSTTAKNMVSSAFVRADSNHDGRLSREEAAKFPAIATRFDEIDTDKDGLLSMEEFAAALATY